MRKKKTEEEKHILDTHHQAVRELYKQAQMDMRLCERGLHGKRPHYEFDATPDADGNVLYVMRLGDEILQIRRLRVVVSARFAVMTEPELMAELNRMEIA